MFVHDVRIDFIRSENTVIVEVMFYDDEGISSFVLVSASIGSTKPSSVKSIQIMFSDYPLFDIVYNACKNSHNEFVNQGAEIYKVEKIVKSKHYFDLTSSL